MLTPSAKPANRFRTSGETGCGVVLGRSLTLLCLPLIAAVAATDTPLTDAAHRVGLADSRVGYESASYVTDSKGSYKRSESDSRFTS